MLFNVALHRQATILNILAFQFLILNKYYRLPRFKTAKLYISIRKFALSQDEFLDHPKFYNYVLLFKYYFGVPMNLINYSTVFSLRVWYAYFDLAYFFKKPKDIYFLLYYSVFELQGLQLLFDIFLKKYTCTLIMWDILIFADKKTSGGMFDLVDPLRFFFHFTWGDLEAKIFVPTKVLFSTLKIL